MRIVPEVIIEYGLPADRVRKELSRRLGRHVASLGEGLVAYAVRKGGRIIYIGCGSFHRALSWRFPCKYTLLDLVSRPTIVMFRTGMSKDEAIELEAALISRYDPPFNVSRRGSTGGLRPWNKGLQGDPRLGGGRPKGSPVSEDTRKKLSESMKGKATKWMIGKTPWNKGLTKDDPRVAAGCESYDEEKRRAAAVKIWKKRRGT